MSEETKTFECPCGSVVKATNKKAHERTKRHQNFVGANQPQPVRGQKPLMPPIPVRSRKHKEDNQAEDEDEEDYDSQEDSQAEDGDELEDDIEDDDELIMAVEHLVEGQHLISEQVQNLHNSVPASFESIRKRLDEVEANFLKSLKEFVTMYNEHRASDKQAHTQRYINDKCTPSVMN